MAEPKDQIVSAIVRARAELEEALYALEKLPVLSQSPTAFAAHALNNFLTVTRGTVELLHLSLADHPDPQVHTWLEALQQAATLMTNVVCQLVNAPTNRDEKLRFENVDLAIMVGHFLKFYNRIADQKKIRCIFESRGDIPTVWTDRIVTAVVLENLLSNAVKYSPSGSRISVRLSSEPDGVVCSICDEGPGLSDEDRGKLFQRGAQLTPKPTGGEPSTGYGLAVAKELIEKLGGTIWCESVLGQGSCFSFRLPRYQEQLHGAMRTQESLESAPDLDTSRL
jgi:signal transduction histidine kinase